MTGHKSKGFRWGAAKDGQGNLVPLDKEQFEKFYRHHISGRGHDADCWTECADCEREGCMWVNQFLGDNPYAGHTNPVQDFYFTLCDDEDCATEDICSDCIEAHKLEHVIQRHRSAGRFPIVVVAR